MIARLQAHLKDIAITRVANVTGLDIIGIPVVMTVRPLSRSVAVAQGKGFSYHDAWVSGVMESLESYHAETINNDRIVRTDRHEFSNEAIIDDLNMRVQKADLSKKINWIEGIEIISGKRCYVPADLVDTDFRANKKTDGLFLRSTNGLSSGVEIIDATLHGIYEVIERDALTRWSQKSFKQRAKTRINLSTIKDDKCQLLIDKFKSAGIAVGLWDVTSDIDVPTMYCVIAQTNKGIIYGDSTGVGTHLCKYQAVTRALTEAAQSRLTKISGARDDIETISYTSREIFKMYIDVCQSRRNKNFEAIGVSNNATLEQDLSEVQSKLSKVGVSKIAVVDLIQKHINIPVVRVIVPKLEAAHDHPLYQPGARAL